MPGRPLRVLIVEDEPRFREFLADVARDLGLEAVSASTAMSALRLVRGEAPDVVLLDLSLPVMDGLSFLEQFRVECPTAPVLILTAFGDLESARRAIHLGVTEFLAKPIDLGVLEEAIRSACRKVKGGFRAVPLDDVRGVTTEVKPLADVERETILEALRLADGNRSLAARKLGISRRALYNKLALYQRVRSGG